MAAWWRSAEGGGAARASVPGGAGRPGGVFDGPGVAGGVGREAWGMAACVSTSFALTCRGECVE